MNKHNICNSTDYILPKTGNLLDCDALINSHFIVANRFFSSLPLAPLSEVPDVFLSNVFYAPFVHLEMPLAWESVVRGKVYNYTFRRATSRRLGDERSFAFIY